MGPCQVLVALWVGSPAPSPSLSRGLPAAVGDGRGCAGQPAGARALLRMGEPASGPGALGWARGRAAGVWGGGLGARGDGAGQSSPSWPCSPVLVQGEETRLWKRRLCCHGHGACHPRRESLPGRSPFAQGWQRLQKGGDLWCRGCPGPAGTHRAPYADLGAGSCLVLSPAEAGSCAIPTVGSLPCPCVSAGAVVMLQGTPTSPHRRWR